MSYAVFITGGKQYRVEQGDVIEVEKLGVAEGKNLTFDDVILVSEDGKLKVGQPKVDGASVVAKVVEQFRGKKGVAFKMKRRKGFHKTKGFRRHLTRLEITKITV